MRTTSIAETTKRDVYGAVEEALIRLEYAVVDHDYKLGYILAQKQLSRFAFAREIIIDIHPTGDGAMRMVVNMRSIGIQIVNWESNKQCEQQLVDEVLSLLDEEEAQLVDTNNV